MDLSHFYLFLFSLRCPTHFLDIFYFVLNFGTYLVIGILILINVVLSLVRCDEGESITGD